VLLAGVVEKQMPRLQISRPCHTLVLAYMRADAGLVVGITACELVVAQRCRMRD